MSLHRKEVGRYCLIVHEADEITTYELGPSQLRLIVFAAQVALAADAEDGIAALGRDIVSDMELPCA